MQVMESNVENKEVAKIEVSECGLKTHSFSEKIGDVSVSFSLLKLKDSLFVWIGSATEPRLASMCVAMKTPYESVPLTTEILGTRTDDLSSGLASQLTRRLSKPVYVSVNIELDRLLFPELIKRLKDEIANNPQCF